MRKMNKKGFTLVEIMIVVAIIGLLAAIAIPNFVRARETALKNACIANLKQIQGAVQVWAIDNGALDTADPSVAINGVNVVPTYLRVLPKCGGTDYALPATVATTPTCPKGDGATTGHELP